MRLLQVALGAVRSKRAQKTRRSGSPVRVTLPWWLQSLGPLVTLMALPGRTLSCTSPQSQERGWNGQVDSGLLSSPTPRFLLPVPRTQALPPPWASRGGDLQPPTPTPEGLSGVSERTCCLFWRPPNTVVPKSTPSARGEVALCQQRRGGVKAATVARGRGVGGWPGPFCSLVMRIPHAAAAPRVPSLSFPPMFPHPGLGRNPRGKQAKKT